MASIVYIAVICVLLCTAFSSPDPKTGEWCDYKLYPRGGKKLKLIKGSTCYTWICHWSQWKVQKIECGKDGACYPDNMVVMYSQVKWKCAVGRSSAWWYTFY
ncbi:hypothetical protein PoB_002839900 [Plakobranchus ocellatus]|uniref:Uncharacterized protein n=1 Tax=Plakobranchus ocellatus TaxID=259542 RepID=A0AAV4A2P1_9GAST|nr:hypothetical protein PoB_002839900 [Plakobranchus ocellatus]